MGAPTDDATPVSGSPPSPEPFPTPQPSPERPPLLDRLPWYTVPAVLIGIPLLVAAGVAVAPHVVYDQLVWPAWWGPIKADAEGHAVLYLCPDGSTDTFCAGGAAGIPAHSGYNVINTSSWAVLLGFCILGAAQILRRTKTTMGPKLILGAAGWVVAGSIFHVLEDVGLFAAPTQYWFITPPIYLLFAAGGVGSLLVGHYLRGVGEKAGLERALQKLLFIVAIPIILYLLMWDLKWNQVTHYVNPVFAAVFGLVAYGRVAMQWRRKGHVDPSDLVGWMSVGWILLGLAFVTQFIQTPWYPSDPSLRHPVFGALWAPVIAAGCAGLAFLFGLLTIGRFEKAGRKNARDYSRALMQPLNLLLIGSQMLDAFATAIGIDTGGYNEKHVLSGGVIDWTRQLFSNGFQLGSVHLGIPWAWGAAHPTFLGFVPVKAVVSLLVVYALEVNADPKRNQTLTGLVQFAIIMVGLGPGIRDFLRMSLGV